MFKWFAEDVAKKKNAENVGGDIIVPAGLPPIGAMFSDNDHPQDEHFMKVIGYEESDYKTEKEVRFESFPTRSVYYSNFSWDYIKKRYTRLSPEVEAKWNDIYFKDKEAYYKDIEATYTKKYEDEKKSKLDAIISEISQRIENKQKKFVVIRASDAVTFEDMLNLADTNGLKLVYCGTESTQNFVAVMERQ